AVTAGPGLPDRTGFSDSRCRRCRISRVGGCTSATEPRRGLPRGMAEAVRLGSSLVANPGRRELFLVDAKPDANAQRLTVTGCVAEEFRHCHRKRGFPFAEVTPSAAMDYHSSSPNRRSNSRQRKRSPVFILRSHTVVR